MFHSNELNINYREIILYLHNAIDLHECFKILITTRTATIFEFQFHQSLFCLAFFLKEFAKDLCPCFSTLYSLDENQSRGPGILEKL